jgi:uncharacterized damage-inducible protein DinB
MTPAPDPQRWSDYSGSLRAVLDEYARAIRDYETVLRGLPSDRYTARTALSDEHYACVRDIAAHVVGAAYSYADHIQRALDRNEEPPPRRAIDVATPADAINGVWAAFDQMVEVLRRIKDWSDDQQGELRFVTRWKQPYDIEQMLEHAIVHILRHRRQLERWREAPAA